MTLESGWEGYFFLFLAGFLATEPWRWLGVWLSQGLDVDSEILQWVHAVSSALVAGLVARMVFFPLGALAGTPLSLRLGAFAAGLLVFLLAGRILALGIAAGVAVLILGQFLL